jgi:hypothetical protein
MITTGRDGKISERDGVMTVTDDNDGAGRFTNCQLGQSGRENQHATAEKRSRIGNDGVGRSETVNGDSQACVRSIEHLSGAKNSWARSASDENQPEGVQSVESWWRSVNDDNQPGGVRLIESWLGTGNSFV